MLRRPSPLPPRAHLLRRLAGNGLVGNGLVGLGIVGGSMAVGTAGYHTFADLGWLDAALNAAMILTGMGPVSPLTTPDAKAFGIAYALYSGVAFLTVVAVVLAPLVHRFLHRLHLDLYDEPDGADRPGPA